MAVKIVRELEEPKVGSPISWDQNILFSSEPTHLEADFPMVGMARNLMQFKRNGGRIRAVVDPRLK